MLARLDRARPDSESSPSPSRSVLRRSLAWVGALVRRASSRRTPVPAEPPAVAAPPLPTRYAVIATARSRVPGLAELMLGTLAQREGDRTVFVDRSSSGPGAGPAALGLSLFEELLACATNSGDPVHVYVADQRLRSELAAVCRAFPGVHLVGRPRSGAHVDLATRCRTRVAARVLERQRCVPAPARVGPRDVPLEVATDASMRSRHARAGLAAVSIDGQVLTAYRTAAGDVLTAEMLAIELALTGFGGRPLDIRSDSLRAVDLLNGSGRPGCRRHEQEVARIRALLTSSGSTLRWVRGHAGEHLNEAADRAARATRRQVELDLPATQLRDVVQRIAADLLDALATGARDEQEELSQPTVQR